jgi:transposase
MKGKVIKASCKAKGCSKSSLYRRERMMKQYGSESVPKQPRTRKSSYSLNDLANIYWIKNHDKSATIIQVQDFMYDITQGKTISTSSISRAYQELSLRHKIIHHFSGDRDESDRELFWLNGPYDLVRPGMCGVDVADIVDIDEAGRCLSDTQPKMGHAPKGIKCTEVGCGPRAGHRLSFAIAVDTTSGVVSKVIYDKGTTTEKFYLWMKCNVLPALRGKRRIIVMDNLSAHLTSELKELIKSCGHTLVLRPTHSPDFGGVEWVFHFVTEFLVRHRFMVNDNNMRAALNSCFDLVTKHDIEAYMSDAHFYVKNLIYKPYLKPPDN